MTLDSFPALLHKAAAGSLVRGDTLYVSSVLYAQLTREQCERLWRLALEARACLVTDAAPEPEAPITVRRAAPGFATDDPAA